MSADPFIVETVDGGYSLSLRVEPVMRCFDAVYSVACFEWSEGIKIYICRLLRKVCK